MTYNRNTAFDNEKKQGMTEEVSEKIKTFSSLKYANFRYLFTGTTLSNASQWLMQVTLSWLVYDITGSGTMVGTVNMLRSISALIMIPFAGILIDRLSHRKILLLNNSWLFNINDRASSYFRLRQHAIHPGIFFSRRIRAYHR